jgi:hypothetical protein
MDHPGYGRNEVTVRGPKKMTRKQRYEFETKLYDNPQWLYAPVEYKYPQVEARYRISMHPHMSSLPAMHPDGSVFYEYVEGSRFERPSFY